MQATMITQELYLEGINYAERNFLQEDANHLKVDKKLIREKFNLDGKKILDFGCGMGGMSLWYAKNWDCTVHGLDIDHHHVAIANDLKHKHRLGNVQFEVRNLLEKPLKEKYDFVMMNDVAEHIPLPILKDIFKALSGSLEWGGKVFVTYPPWQSPYASHVQHVVNIPWCQFLPQGILLKLIEANNRPIVGQEESDLVSAYKGLNRLTHDKLMGAVNGSGLKPVFRKSHSFLNNVSFLKELNLRFFPLNFLVTKEFILFEKR